MHGQRSREVIDHVFPMNGVLEPLQVADSSVEWVMLPHVVFDWLQTHVPPPQVPAALWIKGGRSGRLVAWAFYPASSGGSFGSFIPGSVGVHRLP